MSAASGLFHALVLRLALSVRIQKCLYDPDPIMKTPSASGVELQLQGGNLDHDSFPIDHFALASRDRPKITWVW